jgi:hypothetical protein
VNASENQGTQPFYFKSYNKTIGVARNLNDLQGELARLAKENPEAVVYHLREGHIVQWLSHTNEKELAEQLKDVKSIEQARMTVANYLESLRLRTREKERASVTQNVRRRKR